MIDSEIKPLVIQSFNQYTPNPTVFAMDGDLHKAHNFYFYNNGFKDGVIYQNGLFKRVGKVDSRSVDGLHNAIAVKDVRLLLQEQDLKRYKRMIESRNKALNRLQDLVKEISELKEPEKISMRYAQTLITQFNDVFFNQFSSEII